LQALRDSTLQFVLSERTAAPIQLSIAARRFLCKKVEWWKPGKNHHDAFALWHCLVD